MDCTGNVGQQHRPIVLWRRCQMPAGVAVHPNLKAPPTFQVFKFAGERPPVLGSIGRISENAQQCWVGPLLRPGFERGTHPICDVTAALRRELAIFRRHQTVRDRWNSSVEESRR